MSRSHTQTCALADVCGLFPPRRQLLVALSLPPLHSLQRYGVVLVPRHLRSDASHVLRVLDKLVLRPRLAPYSVVVAPGSRACAPGPLTLVVACVAAAAAAVLSPLPRSGSSSSPASCWAAPAARRTACPPCRAAAVPTCTTSLRSAPPPRCGPCASSLPVPPPTATLACPACLPAVPARRIASLLAGHRLSDASLHMLPPPSLSPPAVLPLPPPLLAWAGCLLPALHAIV